LVQFWNCSSRRNSSIPQVPCHWFDLHGLLQCLPKSAYIPQHK
jgi:hypothetical protein